MTGEPGCPPRAPGCVLSFMVLLFAACVLIAAVMTACAAPSRERNMAEMPFEKLVRELRK